MGALQARMYWNNCKDPVGQYCNQHWIRYWFGAWWHQAITWADVEQHLWYHRPQGVNLVQCSYRLVIFWPSWMIKFLTNVGNFIHFGQFFLKVLSRTFWDVSIMFNLLLPSDAIWKNESGSTLAQVMACCLMATSHYLNQSWLIINKVQWH